MNTRIVYRKIYLDNPLLNVQINASEVLPDDQAEARMNQLASYTVDSPYVPADRLHGLRWFANSISLEVAP